MYALRCRCFRSQEALRAALKRCGEVGLVGLDDFPQLRQDAFELLNAVPADVTAVQEVLLRRATKKIEDRYEICELMALRVQCSWRCRDGRLSLFLARQARAERLRAEEEERRRQEWAARLVQTAYRGRLGRKTLADLVLRRKKEALQKAYILERKAREAHERCERDQHEMIIRERVRKEVEERRKKQEAEWEAEQSALISRGPKYRPSSLRRIRRWTTWKRGPITGSTL